MSTTLTWTNGYEAAAEVRRITRRNELAEEYANAVAFAKHAGMMVAAPLIGLACVIVLPFAGIAALVWMAYGALPKHAKDVILFLAAPFIGLVYATLFPVIGLGALAWMGAKALAGK